MKKFAANLVALSSTLILSNCGTGAAPSTSSPSGSPTAKAGSPRLINSPEIKNQKYVLKADLDFSKAEKKETTAFKGRQFETKFTNLVYYIVDQRNVSAEEAMKAPRACSLIVSTSTADARTPIVFPRTTALRVTDYGLMNDGETSSFQLSLSQEFLKAFALRCRNVVNKAELETQIGHLFQIGR